MALRRVSENRTGVSCKDQADDSNPLVQSSEGAADVFVCMSFFVALFNYIRFAREVIWQM